MKSIVGKILYDRYRIVRQLSQNDWSIVYLAEDLAPNSQAHCKIEQLQPQYDHEILGAQSWQKVLQTFETKGEMLQNVSQHPQIPQLLAFFECDREFYLVREHIDGVSLKQRLDRGLIEEDEAIAWLQETLHVLEFIHQQGIAHLNIQPASLIQHQNGNKFLTDFAALKNAVLFDSEELTSSINPDFSAPEQLKSDFNADIYSLGKTMVYALTGKLASSIQTQSAPLDNPDSLNEPPTEISSELAKVLNKMLVIHPLQMYQSASEVLTELDFERNMVTFPPPFSNHNNRAATKSTARKKTKNKATSSSDSGKSGIVWFLLSLPFLTAAAIVFIGLNKNSDRLLDFSKGNDVGNFVEYSNSDYQFALKYPDTWSKRQIDDPITGEIVVFASPPETAADAYSERVYIAIDSLSSEPTNLEEYSQSVLERIGNTINSNVELAEDFKTEIDNSPARIVIYSRTEEGLQLRQMEAFTIKNDRVYIAIYTAETAKFSEFYPTVKKIVDSWEID